MMGLQIQGAAELKKRLRALPYELQKKVLQPATRYGAQVIAAQARANAQALDDPGTGRQIARNITVKYRAKRSRSIRGVVYSVGVEYPRGRMPKGNPDDGVNTPHWHLLELGTEEMAARPFMLPALIMRSQDVSDEIVRRATERLDKLKI